MTAPIDAADEGARFQHIPGISRFVRSEYRTYSGPILPKRLFLDRGYAKSSNPVPIPPGMCMKADVNSLDLISHHANRKLFV
jgi:hypothetical protein